MKTITIKLPEDEAKQLDEFIRKKKYVSKSEFIRHLIMQKLEHYQKEKIGWLVIAEKSMKTIWDNSTDDNFWKEYL